MSKFLKFIVNLVVLLVIVVALALMVPQFLGVETVMNDNTEIETNLPTGSVAYGRTVNVSDLKEGDRILYSEGAQTYVYEITDMDASGGSYQVQDIYNVQSDDATVKLTKNVSKVVLIVPFIGYAAIALQTTEGLIVVGLGVVFLVILFILSELWRKDKDEEDEEEDSEEDGEDDEASGTEEEEEEEVLSRRERKRLKREEKRRRKLEKKGYDEEDEEEETLAPLKFPEEPAADTDQVTSDEEPEQLADADEEIFRQVSQPEEAEDATAILPDPDALFEDRDASDIETEEDREEPEQVTDATVILPDMEELSQEDSVEADLEEEFSEEPEIPEESEVPEEPEEETLTQILPEIAEPEEIIEEAETEYDNNIEETVSSSQEIQINSDLVPVPPTVEELIQKAQAAGDAPEIKKDEENDVTILDYSEIL